MILYSKELSVNIFNSIEMFFFFLVKSAAGPKRALPALAATVLKNPKIQEAGLSTKHRKKLPTF